jgi:hypothetical protein
MGPGRKHRFNVFERIKSIKEILAPVVPDGDAFRVRGVVMRCAKYQAGLIKTLDSTERKAYNLLLRHGHKPKKVYGWLLLEDVPPHIREKLVQNRISLRQAREQYVRWKRLDGTRTGTELMEEIRNVIGRLRWKSQEELTTAL